MTLGEIEELKRELLAEHFSVVVLHTSLLLHTDLTPEVQSQVYYARGEALFRQREYGMALECFNKSSQTNDTCWRIAQCHFHSYQYEKVLEIEDLNDERIIIMKALAHEQLGQGAEAAKKWKQVLHTNPAHFQARLHLSQLGLPVDAPSQLISLVSRNSQPQDLETIPPWLKFLLAARNSLDIGKMRDAHCNFSLFWKYHDSLTCLAVDVYDGLGDFCYVMSTEKDIGMLTNLCLEFENNLVTDARYLLATAYLAYTLGKKEDAGDIIDHVEIDQLSMQSRRAIHFLKARVLRDRYHELKVSNTSQTSAMTKLLSESVRFYRRAVNSTLGTSKEYGYCWMVIRGLLEVYTDMANKKLAQDLCKFIVERFSETPQMLAAAGYSYLKFRMYEDARAAFTAALSKDGRCADAVNGMASYFSIFGQHDLAIKHLLKYVEVCSDSSDKLYAQLGDLYALKDDLNRACDAYRIAISYNRNFGRAVRGLARVETLQLSNGHKNSAMSDFEPEDAVEADTGDSMDYF